jgi:hypothetical protein
MRFEESAVNRSGPASTSEFVATRSTTIDGVKITRGVTRISKSNPWLRTNSSLFAEVASYAGRNAIRSRHEADTTTTSRRTSGDLELWFVR